MGYMRHHAIIVTGYDRAWADKAWRIAMALFPGQYIPLVTSGINDYHTLFVGPDGSKEGWEESDDGDASRAALVDWLRTEAVDEDGGSYLTWVEVQYGDEDDENKVVSCSEHAP
jgi:hypothetical protein